MAIARLLRRRLGESCNSGRRLKRRLYESMGVWEYGTSTGVWEYGSMGVTEYESM